MAANLIKTKKYDVTVWNRTTSKAEELAKSVGGVAAKTPEEALKSCDTVISMLWNAESIEQTLFSHIEMLKGKTVINMSTVAPNENKNFKDRLEKLGEGSAFIECPVLGTATAAKSGSLQVIFDGNDEQFNQHFLPVLLL